MDSAQQSITIVARKHIVFKLHDVLYLSSSVCICFESTLQPYSQSLGSVKLHAD